MTIKGTHTLDSSVSQVWPLLEDPDVLARIAPGVSRIERIGPDRYKAVSEISVGPVRGSFEGEMAISEKVRNEKMKLHLNQKSKMGNAEASILMRLSPAENERTLISYDGTAKVSGRLASMGQRILGGVVKTMSRQVFQELDHIIAERKSAESLGQPSRAEDAGLVKRIMNKIVEIWKSLFR